MEIARPEIDQIMSAQNTDESVYSSQFMQINQVFELPEGYLLTTIQISLSSQFTCEGCNEAMYPEYYRSVHGYEYKITGIRQT